jgi:hypothetical protein
MFQELGKVTPEFIYKAIEFVIISHCGEVETLMYFPVFANRLRTFNRMMFMGQLPITLFNLFTTGLVFQDYKLAKVISFKN